MLKGPPGNLKKPWEKNWKTWKIMRNSWRLKNKWRKNWHKSRKVQNKLLQKLEKRSQKRTCFLALQLLLQLCRCFGVPATTGGKKPLCKAFTFATLQLLCQLFFDPWTFVSFNLTFFGFQLLCRFFLDVSFLASTFVWPSNCCANFFWPFNFGVNFCLTFQLVHQLFFELSTFVSAFSNS